MKINSILITFLVLLLSGCSTTNSEVAEVESATEIKESIHIPEVINHDDYWNNFEYDDFARNPDDHFGNKTNLVGKVIQVIEDVEDKYTMFLHNQNVTGNTSVFFIETDLLKERILEDDEVRFYGVGAGEYSYETTQGVNKTVPLLYIHDYEIYKP